MSFFSSSDFNINNLQLKMSSLELSFPDEENSNDQSEDNRTNCEPSCSTGHRRLNLRNRSNTTEENLHKINRRVISKPKKMLTGLSTSEKDIKKFYLNKKLTKLKPTCLETIFEEDEEHNADSDTIVTTISSQMGRKKLKRSLSFPDYYNIPKATVQRRKKRIKSCLGNIRKMEKFSMEYFLQKLHSNDRNPNEIENALSSFGTTTSNIKQSISPKGD